MLVIPLWVTEWVPLVDIPQHAAQLSVAHRWDDGQFDYARYFEFNWLANSVTPYSLGYLLALAVPIGVSIKLLLCASLLGIPLATWRLIRAVGGNDWWVFATVPVAYGFAFAWGFLSFVFAAPVGLLLVLAAVRYREVPSARRAWVIVGLVHLLFSCHVLVLSYAGLVSLTIIALGTTSWRTRIRGALSLASVVPITAAWWVATRQLTPGSTPMEAHLEFQLGLDRVSKLIAHILGEQTPTRLGAVIVTILIAAPFAIGARFSRQPWRLAPLIVALVFYFVVPMNVLGTAFVFPRFSLFVVPGLLFALDSTAPERTLLRAAPVVAALAWLGLVAGRYYAFGVESRGVQQLLRGIEPNKRLLALIDNPGSAMVHWAPYLHIACWYQVERGGIADFSFAEFFPNRFRYKPGMDPPLPFNLEWSPQQFIWPHHGGSLYDYFLVRRGPRSQWSPFIGTTSTIELVAHSGTWFVFRQTRP